MSITRDKAFGLGPTFIAIFVVLIVATAGLIGHISFRNGQRSAKMLASRMQDAVQARVENNLNQFLSLPHALNRINATAIQKGLVHSRDLMWQRARFLHHIQAFDQMGSCAFGSEEGDFTGAGRRREGDFECAIADKRLDNDYRVYRLDEKNEPTEMISVVHDYWPQQRSWYRAAVEAKRPIWSPIYVWASQSNAGLSAVLPVYDHAGQLLGVQLAALSLEHIGHFLRSIAQTSYGQIFIMERTGLLVASSQSDPILEERPSGTNVQLQRVSARDSANPLMRAAIADLNQHSTTVDQIASRQRTEFKVDGQRYFACLAPYRDQYGLDWVVTIAIPELDLMGNVQANLWATIWASVMIVAVTIILGVVVTRKMTGPILRLHQATQGMSVGQWEPIENQTRFKEVRQLTDSFNQMARKLSGTLATLEQRVRERTSELTSVNQELNVEIAERKKTEAERERLIAELQAALDNVKQLTGLLPICAHCKKIRDDSGYWQQVEVYVRDHSDAEFSHGICPDCLPLLYPEVLQTSEQSAED